MVMTVNTTPKQQTSTYPIHWSYEQNAKVASASRNELDLCVPPSAVQDDLSK